MKFKSVRRNGNRRFVGNAPFDVKFMKNVEFADEGIFIFYYDLYDFQTGFPIEVTKAYFTAEITDDNLFVSSTVYYIGDESPTFIKYLTEYGDLECEVEMSEQENKKLMLYLLNKTLQNKIAKHANN